MSNGAIAAIAATTAGVMPVTAKRSENPGQVQPAAGVARDQGMSSPAEMMMRYRTNGATQASAFQARQMMMSA